MKKYITRPVLFFLAIFLLIIPVVLSGCANGSNKDENIFPQETNSNYRQAEKLDKGKSIVSMERFKELAENAGAKVTTDDEGDVHAEFGSGKKMIEYGYSDVSGDPILDALGTDKFEENWKASDENDMNSEIKLEEKGTHYYLYSVFYPETNDRYAVYEKVMFVDDKNMLFWLSLDQDTVNNALTQDDFLQSLTSPVDYADCVDAENAKIILRNYGDVSDLSENDNLCYALETDDYYIEFEVESEVSDEDFFNNVSKDFITDYVTNYNDSFSTLTNMELLDSGVNYYRYDALEIFEEGDTVPFHLWRYRPYGSNNLISIISNEYTKNSDEYQKIMNLLIQSSADSRSSQEIE